MNLYKPWQNNFLLFVYRETVYSSADIILGDCRFDHLTRLAVHNLQAGFWLAVPINVGNVRPDQQLQGLTRRVFRLFKKEWGSMFF